MINSIPQFVILVFSIIFHEIAHGRVALWRGDTSARDAGRLTFNPLPHIDPIGTIVFPLFLVLTGSNFLFGWAKPVPVNPLRFREMKNDMALVGAAGPASNFLLAVVSSMLLRLTLVMFPTFTALVYAFYFGVIINLVLCFFNLIPIPPLDGSRILMRFLPDDLAMKYAQLERFGFIIIFAMFLLGLYRVIVFPFVIFFMQFMVPAGM